MQRTSGGLRKSQGCKLGMPHPRRDRQDNDGELPQEVNMLAGHIRRRPSSKRCGDSRIARPRQRPRVGRQPLMRRGVAVDFVPETPVR
jgi:hypothetical protein